MMAAAAAWVVVALHIVFGLAESVGWSGMARRFGFDKQATETTRSLALNQGAYNAGIAVVMGWALVAGQDATVFALLLFIVAMAVVGAATVRWTIFVLQGVPALLALALRMLG
jgi:putative membrane protein